MPGECRDKDIKITPTTGPIKVFFKDQQIARSEAALELREAGLPMRLYLPRNDVDAGVLEPSDHTSHCPYKGDASYHHLQTSAGRAENAVWYYRDPCPLVEKVQDHLAFWGDDIRFETA